MLNSIYGPTVMELDFSLDLFEYAFTKTIEDEIYASWSLQYPQMTAETFISYEDYKKSMIKENRKGSKITHAQIEAEMEQIIKQHERR